ncbi:MAG: phosphoribosylformylglycinamidine synthase [Chlamydiales bacterium]
MENSKICQNRLPIEGMFCMVAFLLLLFSFLNLHMTAQVILLQGKELSNNVAYDKLQQKICESLSSLQKLHAEYFYFIDVDQELSERETALLKELLNATSFNPAYETKPFFVIPRLGTLSSWSSKATDIVHNCGLKKINHIERGIAYCFIARKGHCLTQEDLKKITPLLYDRMMESLVTDLEDGKLFFQKKTPSSLTMLPLLKNGRNILFETNSNLGLALSENEIDHLFQNYSRLNRNPHDIELMMFAQVNSEHCRHKVFNAAWHIDGEAKPFTLFDMIKNSSKKSPKNLLSAYHDNAAVIKGWRGLLLFPHPETHVYEYQEEDLPIIVKVETHNHPTSISPFPGAATGVGGEIRDQGATGRGGRSKAGLTGFTVSNLHLPNSPQPWEIFSRKPSHLASSLEIMIRGPLGSAGFNNEFGRPNLIGYFRTFELEERGEIRGYHKPILLAGGIGQIRSPLTHKAKISPGDPIFILGGPSMLVGLGGGAASSMIAGTNEKNLDFASVQRDNAELQRRCQEVIDRCSSLEEESPILSIHDVGAGGLSNAIAEIVHSEYLGCHIELRAIPNAEPQMTPAEIWCNEAQERHVLVLSPSLTEKFEEIARRENCPIARVGTVVKEQQIKVVDSYFNNEPVDLPLELLFGEASRMHRYDDRRKPSTTPLCLQGVSLEEAVKRVLSLPTVAEKTFLISIGDRSVGGLVARDQMVGPWQVPVADAAVTLTSFEGYTGEAMALGERPPLALLDYAASARMAVGEAITNIASTYIREIEAIKLSANWQVAVDHPGEGAGFYEAVHAIGIELCPALGVAIPVGKDSVSMQTVWQEEGRAYKVTSPLSLNITAVAPVHDVRKTVTPQLRLDKGETEIMLIDLGEGKNRLGGSCVAQVFNQIGDHPPDIDHPEVLKYYFQAIQELLEKKLLLAYHDRSDGGLFVTALEMAFAGHTGITLDLTCLGEDTFSILFNEELGALIQIRKEDRREVLQILKKHAIESICHTIGHLTDDFQICVRSKGKKVLENAWSFYRDLWGQTTFQIQSIRDNPVTALEEHTQKLDTNDVGLHSRLTFSLESSLPDGNHRPKVAILREQGTNGYLEMAAAFDRVGFTSVDIHMNDILSGKIDLEDFQGLVASGGFSYGDVLGAGVGWAHSILHNKRSRQIFERFFHREDTFALGVCNGCQMFSLLKDLIPGAEHWPRFLPNRSGSFEARVCMVEITPSPSIFFQGMVGSRIPIVVAHGEGRVEEANLSTHVVLRYIDNYGNPTEKYPANPNGSTQGVTGFTTSDGRVTIMMPHPERVFRSIQHSWHPEDWAEDSPWLQVFRNAYVWTKQMRAD